MEAHGMAHCTGICLHSSLRVANMVANVCGIGQIIYALWLLKEWKIGVASLHSRVLLPYPGFIYTCLAVGMVVCLITLSGHMVANCINNSILSIYIISLCSLLLIQIIVVPTIFFKMDWESLIVKYIDEHHQKFQSFIIFHLKMSRWIIVCVVLAQVSIVTLAITLLAIGTGARSHPNFSNGPGLPQSFLVLPDSSPPIDQSRIIQNLDSASSPTSFLSHIRRVLRN